ncbi:hypothetical protein [Cellulosimicrobium sp. Marseille-Q4280]|uniref:hypothetical protein n=1 Tax=Cellulosimicrobium sp. Marseille-Q4280 TaxID=2937992 RepID=UPI00203CFB72|nr:hypothetical protein [Cellulosimicrobium sp. Marseille-Q4280]
MTGWTVAGVIVALAVLIVAMFTWWNAVKDRMTENRETLVLFAMLSVGITAPLWAAFLIAWQVPAFRGFVGAHMLTRRRMTVADWLAEERELRALEREQARDLAASREHSAFLVWAMGGR